MIQDLPPVMVPEPKTIAEAVKSMHEASWHMAETIRRIEHLAALERETPEFRALQITPTQLTIVDHSPWVAKSIGILNPGSAPVYLGIGGSSANPSALAPSCPGSSSLVLPVEAQDLELSCQAADLAGNTALIFLFRFVTVQPLVLRQVP